MKKIRRTLNAVLGIGMLMALIGLPGCSDQGSAPAPNPTPGAKRDELQKATQSGIPGKTGGAPGKGR
jgi:hypothetical protein